MTQLSQKPQPASVEWPKASPGFRATEICRHTAPSCEGSLLQERLTGQDLQTRVRILQVGPVPPSGNYVGGIGTMLRQMLEAWDLPYQVSTFNTDTTRREYGSVNRLNLVNVRRFLGHAVALVKRVRKERPELVHIHTSRDWALLKDLALVWLVKLFGRCKVAGHIHHASYATLLAGKMDWLRWFQIKLLLGTFDRMVLMSEGIQHELAARLNTPDAHRLNSKSVVLYNFTALPDLPREPKAPSGRTVLFFIGNIGPAKGIFDLIRAVASLRRDGAANLELVLAGPMDSVAVETQVRELIARVGVGDLVRTTGPVFGGEKAALFSGADIFVLPSYGEGVPLSVLEAMAYQLPVVATAVGGIPEIISEGHSGLLVKPGDVEGLTAAIRRLIGSTQLRDEMGKRGRRRVELHHSAREFMKKLDGVYRELLRG